MIHRCILKYCTVIALILIGSLVFFAAQIFNHNTSQNVYSDNSIHFENAHTDDQQEWRVPHVPDHIQNLDQADPELIRHIREHWIIPPNNKPIHLDLKYYKFRKYDEFSEQGQVETVLKLLNQRRDGFFVECGGADGQHNSNSLFLELFYNWTGLLIEVDPTFFVQLQNRNRNAYLVNACLSPTTKPMVLDFTSVGIAGGLSDMIPPAQRDYKNMDEIRPIRVQCFPLYSILAAMGISHVDYLSLDIEGAEIEVLETIPVGGITFDAVTVEKRLMKDPEGTDKKEQDIINLLARHGLKWKKTLKMDVVLGS